MDIERELIVLDVDGLGHDHVHDNTGSQARHGQVSGLLGARLVAVDRTGHVVGRRVSLGQDLAVAVPDDELVDEKLFEGGVEIEFQRAELTDALRVWILICCTCVLVRRSLPSKS